MKKIFLTLLFCLPLILPSPVNASDAEDDFVIIEPGASDDANLTYQQRAKILANDIKQGFLETSKVPGITSCISQGTQMYAGFRSQSDQQQAESITEFYLLQGEGESLDLTSLNAVKDFLEKKLDERVGQNVQKAAGWSGLNVVKAVATCIKVGGEAYYRLRLNQALVWAYQKQVADIGNTGLGDQELLKEAN